MASVLGTSLPLRECGLKYSVKSCHCMADSVTPLAGVWVEMVFLPSITSLNTVTPLAGVWVEIAPDASSGNGSAGHSPCGSVG